MSRICLKCGEGELGPSPLGEDWVMCTNCSRAYLVEDLEHWEEVRARAVAEAGDDEDVFADLLAVYWAEIRRDVPGGGGDDGLRLVVLRPMGDERTVKGSAKPLEGKREVIRQVTGIESNSEEIRDAMLGWLKDPPDSAEFADLVEEAKQARRERRRAKVREAMRKQGFDV